MKLEFKGRNFFWDTGITILLSHLRRPSMVIM